MVALTLLALIAFVVLPAVQMYQQSNLPGATDLTVATYKGGAFDTEEIAYYQRLHGQTNRFLAAVAEQVVAAGGTPRVPNYGMNSNRQMNYGITPFSTPEMAVMTKLYADKASELGMELDDTAIRNWLDLFTDGKLSASQLAGIRAQSSQNTLGESQMFSLLRTELLANLYDRMMTAGLTTGRDLLNSPLVTWNNFLKINQQAKATAYPVLVEEFVSEAPEPNAATIQKLYDEGKDRNPAPNSATPGFRKPYSANIEYVSAHLEDFIGREVEKFTEEQLRTEYKRRVEGGDFTMPSMDFSLPGDEQAAEEPAAPTDSPEESASPEESSPAESPEQPAPADEPATEPAPEPASEEPTADNPESGEPASEEPASEEPATNQPAPPESATEEPAPVEEVPEDQPNADQPPAGETPATDPPPASDGDQDQPLSKLQNEVAVSLVSARVSQDGEPPAGEEPAEQPPAEQPAEEPSEPAAETPATETPATETPATETPATEAPATDNQDAEPAGEDANAQEPPAEEPAKPAGPKPFEEVRDEIARDLARPAATRAYQDSINEAFTTMRDYFTELAVWESDQDSEKPAAPDLKKLAAELGLRYETTGMTTPLDVFDTTFGRAQTGMGGTGGNIVSAFYNDSRPVYSAVRAENRAAADGPVSYSAWKTEAREGYVPKLEEVRDEVIAAAKLQSARELAKAKAKELAEQANASPDKPLAEIVPETRRTLVFEDLGPFPWMMSFGFQFGPIMGNVQELDNVGEEFMRTVFTGPVGEYRVASNVPESVYYVVKATEISPSAEELQTRFMQANQRALADPLSIDDIRTIRQSSAESFEKSINLEFNQEALSGR